MNSQASNLKVSYLPVDCLKTYENNARRHSKAQVRQIASSIEAFGFTNPILIDGARRVIAGHGRVAAAKVLGMTEVPTILLDNLTEDQIRAYILADNRLAEKAGWDKAILAIELQNLMTLDSDFDITVTGFEVAEIDLILEAIRPPDKDDSLELPNQGTSVTRPGDLWILGKHRLLCANALDQPSYKQLLGSRKAQIVFTDPPFNVPIDGHVTGNGSIRHREFAMGSGEMSAPQFIAFLATVFGLLIRHSASGSVHFICMDWRHIGELLSAGRSNYDRLLNLCVWVKNNAGLGSFYRSQHELVFVFKNGKTAHQNNVRFGTFGRNRTNVWEYPNAATFSKRGDEGPLAALHPTVKPVAMIADALLDSSARADAVLDPFLGSGSTLIAAERVGRTCFGIEIDPGYVDVAIRRWQAHTGDLATHELTGKSFNEMGEPTGASHV